MRTMEMQLEWIKEMEQQGNEYELEVANKELAKLKEIEATVNELMDILRTIDYKWDLNSSTKSESQYITIPFETMTTLVNEKLETLSKYPELQKALTNCLNEWNEDEEEDEVFTIRISCHDVTGTCHSMPYLTHNIYL